MRILLIILMGILSCGGRDKDSRATDSKIVVSTDGIVYIAKFYRYSLDNGKPMYTFEPVDSITTKTILQGFKDCK